ncbi:hypothetical protein BGZ61DRAFT_445404 [Ilyonectria robusta]|uniref:uncharacterized protein n=1 Tax=Ilyonectria robusta TaxID=1079257 RepID=UPI001E8EE672|nr:uncharacterized protein BGZ61DRAFT_445404 [Ilyonectria robusta]KAH8733869.1 hypothetical protein BGZ61DRAFT_445404 [Ilyonectria robusta]
MCPAHPRQGSTDRAWPNLATPLYRLDKGGRAVQWRYLEKHLESAAKPGTRRNRSPGLAPPRPDEKSPTRRHSASGAENLVLPACRRHRERSATAQRRLLSKRGAREAHWSSPAENLSPSLDLCLRRRTHGA